ncbi:hypothetical protein BH11PSE3_BH11PSE3_49190 [soil metagenome]
MVDETPKECFFISPIGSADDVIRNEADWVLHALVKPALEPTFNVRRADAYPKNDVITNQVILAIKNADLIVADLTGHNPNVFYELAVAHAFNRPVIPMITADQRIPFDNHLMGTIMYSRARYHLWEQAKSELQQAAGEAIKPGHKISNPITLALGVERLAVSTDDKDQVIAELSNSVRRLAREFEAIKAVTGRRTLGDLDVRTNSEKGLVDWTERLNDILARSDRGTDKMSKEETRAIIDAVLRK